MANFINRRMDTRSQSQRTEFLMPMELTTKLFKPQQKGALTRIGRVRLDGMVREITRWTLVGIKSQDPESTLTSRSGSRGHAMKAIPTRTCKWRCCSTIIHKCRIVSSLVAFLDFRTHGILSDFKKWDWCKLLS